jgi:hypothetical protein
LRQALIVAVVCIIAAVGGIELGRALSQARGVRHRAPHAGTRAAASAFAERLERQWQMVASRAPIGGEPVAAAAYIRCCGITRVRAGRIQNALTINASANTLDYLALLSRLKSSPKLTLFVRVRNGEHALAAVAVVRGCLFGAWISPRLLLTHERGR